MRITKQSRRQAKEMYRSTLINGVMDPDEVRTAVEQLLEKKPRRYLKTLEHFKRLVHFEEERRTVQIVSATSLSAEQQAALISNIEGIYGLGLKISFEENAALIAGVRIRVGSDIYDS